MTDCTSDHYCFLGVLSRVKWRKPNTESSTILYRGKMRYMDNLYSFCSRVIIPGVLSDQGGKSLALNRCKHANATGNLLLKGEPGRFCHLQLLVQILPQYYIWAFNFCPAVAFVIPCCSLNWYCCTSPLSGCIQQIIVYLLVSCLA